MTGRPALKPTGFLESTLLKLIARDVEVRAVEPIGERFRIVTFAGADLAGRAWTPGDMVQVALGGWSSRTYTLFAFDARSGTADVLAYVHGNGIGSAWMASVEPGERCSIVGPRAAVDLEALQRPALVFGDETSIGTVAALAATAGSARGVKSLFEVTSLEAARAALDRLEMRDGVRLVRREDGDAHLAEVERQLLEAFRAAPASRVLLTGKAGSIQRLYKALRRAGMASRQATNAAYWAPGRKGFSGVQR
jgi:NADPH-dependent ferric siderophore reductase